MTTPELDEEAAQAIADRDWWRSAAEIVGAHLGGWTSRRSALFIAPDGRATVEIPDWLAEAITAERARADAAKKRALYWKNLALEQSAIARAALTTGGE